MKLGKKLALNLYYHGSYPYRAWQNAARQAAGRAPVMVLFYHRIADDPATPWTAGNAIFERQIRWLKRNFEFVTLAEAQSRLRAGRNDRPCVSISFDDGYADNCRHALPLLIGEGIPFTYFVSTRNVLEGVPFPHDVIRGRPLAVNTPEEIRALARAGVEIGAHTRTHADLARITDPEQLYDELVVCRDELQALCGRAVRYFAFPYGQHANLSSAAFQMARDAGYAGVCSAYGGYNFPGDDPFHLQRFHVDPDLIRLRNWTTVDPYKLRSIRRFEYQTETLAPKVDAVGACS